MNPVSPQNGRRETRHQEGFLLLGVLFMILLILMALAVAAPKMAEEVRRDKETETMHRGMQYARAIRIFYTKYGRYPSTIDQLVKTQDQRFLRKRYLDPMTGKDDWRIIHLGEAKVAPVGLFGQSVQSSTLTQTGATTSGSSSQFGSSSSGSSFGSSSLGGSSGSGFGGSSNSPFGGSSGSGFGSSGSSSSSSTSTSASTTGGTDPGSGSGSGFGSSPIGGTTTTGQANGSSFGSPGATVGGAPIVGVGLLSKKESIKVYKKQTHYNQWEFVFDPNQSALEASAGAGTNINGASNGLGTNGTSGSGFGATNGSGFGSNNGSGFGSSNGSGFGSSNGSGFGSSGGSGFGGTPSSPVSPTSPVSNSNQ
jgi:type II secretory pathway pseudopilin PulG